MDTDDTARTNPDTVDPAELEALTGPRAASRPDISRLPDAVVCGKPLFGPGDRITIERRASVLTGRPYLDTRTYKVVRLDPATGDVTLWDEEALHFASTNITRAIAAGHTLKLTRSGAGATSKRKRGRPRKEAPPVPPPSPGGEGPKRGRGRPKGSKNRDRATIAAERGAKAALRAGVKGRSARGSRR